jgi:hypothetical protein
MTRLLRDQLQYLPLMLEGTFAVILAYDGHTNHLCLIGSSHTYCGQSIRGCYPAYDRWSEELMTTLCPGCQHEFKKLRALASEQESQ